MPKPDVIKNGQGPRTAFLDSPDANALAETMIAFANTEGGTIVIGLNEDGTPTKDKILLEDIEKTLREADNLCNPTVVVGAWEEIEIEANNKPASSKKSADDDEEDDDSDDDDDKDDDKKSDAKKSGADAKKDDKDDEKSTDKDKKSDDKEDAKVAKSDKSESDDDDDKKKSADKSKTADVKAKSDAKSDAKEVATVPKDNSNEPIRVYMLRVPRSIELHALSDGRVLIRSGVKNRPLGGQEILRLASAKNTGDFESEPLVGATRDDFSRKMLDEYLEKRAERTKRPYNGKIDDLLKEIGAVDAEGVPTVGGVLLFTEYPQKWLPQSSVVFAKFVGKTPRGESGLAGYTRREELTGPLPRLIEAAWNIIWSEMAVSAVVKGLEREETYEYPQFAVREALVNAICHRDYRLKGRRIEIRMYSDRLEVISPGGLPGFITVENIKDEHFSRNPRVVNGLFQWGYIEELGLGIDRMMEVMQQAGHKPPYFDARPYSFAVTLYNERQQQQPPEWTRNTNYRQARALQYIRENGSITNREYRSLCQGVSAETLRLDLVDMVEKGILVKLGSKKGTYYILK